MAVSSQVPRTLLATVTLWTLAILAAPQAALADAIITDVTLFEHENYSKWSLTGSRNGGTRLQLVGSNLANADGSFDSSITVTVGGYPAKVITFLSTPEKIVFDTPALPDGAPDCCHGFLVRLGCLQNTTLLFFFKTLTCFLQNPVLFSSKPCPVFFKTLPCFLPNPVLSPMVMPVLSAVMMNWENILLTLMHNLCKSVQVSVSEHPLFY
jgi:hypothetical protein